METAEEEAERGFEEIDWAEVKRIVRDPNECFRCIQQDLETPEGLKNTRRPFVLSARSIRWSATSR